MRKREYLLTKLKAALKEEYDKDEVEKDVLSIFDKGECTMATVTAYLTDYVLKDVVQQLQQELDQVGLWSKEQPSNPNSDYLKWEIAAMLGRKYKHKEAEEQLLKPYEDKSADFSPEILIAFLKKEGVADSKIEELMKSLDGMKFWEVAEAEVDPMTYKLERQKLADLERDYSEIPIQKSEKGSKERKEGVKKEVEKVECVEKCLLRCIIKALLLEHGLSILTPTIPEFKEPSTVEDLKKETKVLKKLINDEGRNSTDLTRLFEQIENWQPSTEKAQPSIYDLLMSMKVQLIVVDVPDLCRLVEKTVEVESQIESKSIVLFIGETGSGKTTMIKSLLGYKMGKRKFKGMNWITIVEKVTDQRVLDMHSNPSCKSVTRYIVAVKPKPDMKAGEVYLTDSPGWGDTAGVEVQIANIIGVKNALRKCKTVIPVLVISKQSWGARGLGIRNLGQTVASLFQDYESIKGSVVTVFNRFNAQEMEDLEHKLKNLIDEMSSTDLANTNYTNFFTHLHRMAMNKKLLTYEALTDSPHKFMNEILDKSALPPRNLFQNSNPAVKSVKAYCADISKRIKYHLKNGNAELVKYFINNLSRLSKVLDDDSVAGELTTIKGDVETSIREEYKKIVDDFRFKVRTQNVVKRDIQNYQADVNALVQGKGYNKIIEGFDLVNDAERNLEEMAKELSSNFMKERRKEDEESTRQIKNLEILKILFEFKGSNTVLKSVIAETRRSISERIIAQKKKLSSALTQAEYDSAADSFEMADTYLKYGKSLKTTGSVQKDQEEQQEKQLRVCISEHIKKQTDEGRQHLRTFATPGIVQVDKRLEQISASYKLMACIPDQSQAISKTIKEFVEDLKRANNVELEALTKIIMSARNTQITNKETGEFRQRFTRLESFLQIGSLKITTESSLEQVRNSLEGYIESQRQTLERISQIVSKDPNLEELKNNIEGVEMAIKGIDNFSQFGGEELRVQAKNIKDDTLRKLQEALPRIFEGIAGKQVIKYNTLEAKQIISKMREAVDLEEVFSKLNMFESQHKKLKEINARNEKLVVVALNEAKLVIKGSEVPVKHKPTDEDIDMELYSSLSLSSIDMALSFIELISDHSPFAAPETEAKDLFESAKGLIDDFGKYAERVFTKFADMIIQLGKKPVVLSESTESKIHESRESIGERCRGIWRWVRKVYQQLNDIEKKYPTFNRLSINKKSIQEEFTREVQRIHESFSITWTEARASKNKLQQIHILIKKCEIFKASDREIIGVCYDDFVALRDNITKQLAEIDGKLVSRTQKLLDDKNFAALATHLESMKSIHNEDNITVAEANEKLIDYIPTFLKQKRVVLVNLKNQKLDFSQYTDHQEELKSFLKCFPNEQIRLLSEQFEKEANGLKPKIVGEFISQLESNSIQQAEQSIKKLESLEMYINKGDKSTAADCKEQLNAKFAQIKEKIKNNEHEFLSSLFNKNHGKGSKVVDDNYHEWVRSVKANIDRCLTQMKQSKQMKEVEAKKKLAEKFLSYLPTAEIPSLKTQIQSSTEKQKKELEQEEAKMMKKAGQLNQQKKLEIAFVSSSLDHLKVHPNPEVNEEVNRGILLLWEKQKSGYMGVPLKQLILSYKNDLILYLTEAKKYKDLIGDTNSRIVREFNQLLEQHVNSNLQTISEWSKLKSCSSLSETEQLSRKIVEKIEESHACLSLLDGTSEVMETVVVTKRLRDYYDKMTTGVTVQYESVVKTINLKEMFTDKLDPKYFEKFECVQRLGKVVDRIKQDLALQKPTQDSAIVMQSRTAELEKSENILRTFFTEMDDRITAITGFNILSKKHDSLDEKEFHSLFSQFKTSLSIVKAYALFYEYVRGSKIDATLHEKKLVDNIKQIFSQSQRMVDKLETEDDDRKLKLLNQSTLILLSYEKNFNSDKEGQQIKETIEGKLQLTAARVKQLVATAADVCKISVGRIAAEKTKTSNEIYQKQQDLQERCQRKIQINQTDIDNQINGAQDEQAKKQLLNRKKTETDVELTNLKEEQKQVAKVLKQQSDKVISIIQNENAAALEKLSRQLSRTKQLQVNLVAAKEGCAKIIEECLNRVRQEGTKFINLVAKSLQEFGTNYSHLILNSNPKVFASFNSKRFKTLTENAGPEFVAKNIQQLNSDTSKSKSIQQLNSDTSKSIQDTYKKYNMHYEDWTKDYVKDATESFIMKLKAQIKRTAEEVANDYKAKATPNGHLLLAEIFALWTIKKATVSQEMGVEFLYDPHPAQIIAMFLILGICGEKKSGEKKSEEKKGGEKKSREKKIQLGNRLAQVLTGEGKSVVLGGLACYLALIGYDVSCMCYSRLLSRRDYNDFEEMFRELNIIDYVLYGTFGEVTEQLFNTKKQSLRENIKEIMLDDKKCGEGKVAQPREKVLLVDEVDVLFAKEFFGEYYTPSTEIRHKCIEDLATYVWNNKHDTTYEKVIECKQFKECLAQFPRLETMLDYTAMDMVSSVRNYRHSYIIIDGKIGYVLPEGISFKASYGWKTTFAYYDEAERGTIKVKPQDYACISILCCQMSYAELPREFDIIMGVTGTLNILPQCQMKVITQWYDINSFYYIPSVYQASRRQKLGVKVVKTSDHYKEICKAISVQIEKKRPVIVFFSTIDMVNQFYLSDEFKDLKENAMTLTERNDKDSTTARIVRATQAKNITILTRAFGRGIDFVVAEKDVIASGGLHVIQTFISEEESEAKQIEGRTARQGGIGSYQMIIDEDQLKNINLMPTDVEGHSATTIEEKINKARNIYFDNSYNNQIRQAENCGRNHLEAKKLLQNISENKNNEVREQVNKLNKVEAPFVSNGKTVKTVIGIDATGSMSSALAQVLANTKECLFRTYEVLKEKGITGGFEIQMVIYRNYNSDVAKLLQWSPFSNNANDLVNFLKGISTDGGWGNEAIENLYNHILKFETEVDQLIIIGDAAGNSPAQVKHKRTQKGEIYWKNHSRFAEMLNGENLINQLAAKKIPVHSFYIGLGPAAYFKDVSARTGGECSQYKYSQPDAAKMLTDFIVLNVLSKIGGDKRGKEFVTAYKMRFG